MESNTAIRALQAFKKAEKARAGKQKPPAANVPVIMYLKQTPAHDAEKQKKTMAARTAAESGHRFQGKSHRTAMGRLGGLMNRPAARETEEKSNQAKQRIHRVKLLIAYTVTGLAIAAGLLVFVLSEGGHAATEVIADQTVLMHLSPRLAQMRIDESLLNVEEETVQLPDAPTVTSTLFDDNTDAAEAIIDGAQASPEPSPLPTPEPAPTPEAVVPAPVAADDLLSFFMDESGSYYDEAGYSTNSYAYTEDEVYLLAQIITSEARGETFEGMVAVGDVVMNRALNTDVFGNTIARVVKTGQFAYSSRTRPTPAAKRAARAVLEDEYWVLPQNVYFFKSHSRPGKDWGRNDYYTQIKGHCFYLYPYNGRNNGEGIPPKLYERTYRYAQYGCTPSGRVLRIQQMLNAIGFKVSENSYFDRKTRDALALFQETNALAADGVATPDTVTALIKAYGFESYIQDYVSDNAA